MDDRLPTGCPRNAEAGVIRGDDNVALDCQREWSGKLIRKALDVTRCSFGKDAGRTVTPCDNWIGTVRLGAWGVGP